MKSGVTFLHGLPLRHRIDLSLNGRHLLFTYLSIVEGHTGLPLFPDVADQIG